MNDEKGTTKTLLLDRQTCRLSVRQARETFMRLSVPGSQNAGLVGEWPLVQSPPECKGQKYMVVKAGEATRTMSNLYFVPVEAAEALVKRVSGSQEVAA